jgi:hypothetical protein
MSNVVIGGFTPSPQQAQQHTQQFQQAQQPFQQQQQQQAYYVPSTSAPAAQASPPRQLHSQARGPNIEVHPDGTMTDKTTGQLAPFATRTQLCAFLEECRRAGHTTGPAITKYLTNELTFHVWWAEAAAAVFSTTDCCPYTGRVVEVENADTIKLLQTTEMENGKSVTKHQWSFGPLKLGVIYDQELDTGFKHSIPPDPTYSVYKFTFKEESIDALPEATVAAIKKASKATKIATAGGPTPEQAMGTAVGNAVASGLMPLMEMLRQPQASHHSTRSQQFAICEQDKNLPFDPKNFATIWHAIECGDPNLRGLLVSRIQQLAVLEGHGAFNAEAIFRRCEAYVQSIENAAYIAVGRDSLWWTYHHSIPGHPSPQYEELWNNYLRFVEACCAQKLDAKGRSEFKARREGADPTQSAVWRYADELAAKHPATQTTKTKLSTKTGGGSPHASAPQRDKFPACSFCVANGDTTHAHSHPPENCFYNPSNKQPRAVNFRAHRDKK